MNQEQVLSIIRQILLAGGGFAVGKGWVTADQLTQIVGALVMLLGSGWAIYTRRNAGLIAAAAAQPNVAKIVADPVTANTIPNNKVVAQ